jgi:hypothetical protein
MMKEVARDRDAMVAGMNPTIRDGQYVFCTTTDLLTATAAFGEAIAYFREDEGDTLVLGLDAASEHGFDTSVPMAWITLNVFSALDGVGLTAAIAPALADVGMPCNVVAAFHHDHLFVPHHRAGEALAILERIQQSITPLRGG